MALLLAGAAGTPPGAPLQGGPDARKPDPNFAILFLKRATRALDVASEDRFQKR